MNQKISTSEASAARESLAKSLQDNVSSTEVKSDFRLPVLLAILQDYVEGGGTIML